MKKLIEALKIFSKYQNHEFPTACEDNILMVMDITEDEVSEEDCKRLNVLGFWWDKHEGYWYSHRYGSA